MVRRTVEKRKIVDWWEDDVHTPWRKYLCFTQRAGVTSDMKRRTRRRERRERNKEMR